jgi:glutathione S-transferase
VQLIGMLDSPYVRRAAITLRLLGLPFEHRPISVFRQYDEFAAINPVVGRLRSSATTARC